MTELHVPSPEGVTLRHEVAGAGSRSAAATIDLALLVVGVLSVVFVLGAIASADVTGLSQFFVMSVVGGILLVPTLYQVLFGVFWRGQTPGKRLFGLRVTDTQGYPPSVLQHVLRGLFWPLEVVVLGWSLPIGLILIVVTARRQRLGDLVAGTLVLREPGSRGIGDPYSNETYAGLEQRTLPLSPTLAARLDPADRRLIRDALARVDLDRKSRADLLKRAARLYAERLGLGSGRELSALQARAFLKEIHLYLRAH
jgi:uncharacterized RDD family membrane protein YckC